MQINIIAKIKDYDAFLQAYQKDDCLKLFNGKCLLFYSISNNDLKARYEISNFLLNNGIEVYGVNEEGESLLHVLLSRTNHDLEKTTKLIERLVQLGVDINILDSENRLALQYLINMKFSDEELMPLYNIWLSKLDMKFAVKNNWGFSPIDLAKKMPYRQSFVERIEKQVITNSGTTD